MNSSNNLVPFTNDGLELVIDIISGQCFASQSAVARMCEVSETAIRKWITSNQIDVIIAGINTATGLKTSNLLPESSICKVLAKYNPALLVVCAQAGLRIYLHKLAGYEVSSTATQPKTEIESAIAAIGKYCDDINRRFLTHEHVLAELQESVQTLLIHTVANHPVAEILQDRYQNNKPETSKEAKLSQAYAEILEIRDRWCEEVGISSTVTGDNAFAQAVKSGKVPDIDRLLKTTRWGNRSGISRGTLMRVRKKLGEGIAPRNLDRPKEKKIDKYEGIAEWVQVQRKQHPEETLSCLHRRMQLQHPDKPVSRSTLSRWLETA
jgi:hypothetical protein